MAKITAEEVEGQYHHLVEAGEYADALTLVTHYVNLFPKHAQSVVYYWRMDMACRLDHKQMALKLLHEAVEAGHWYSNLDENPDFDILKDAPQFGQLMKMCRQRRAEEIANSKPVQLVLQPGTSAKQYPFVFALHGNSSNVDSFALHWHKAVESSWLVGLPQAPQAYGPNSYSWNDWDWAIVALKQQFATLCQNYSIDAQRVVLAGFSMGAGLALWLALNNIIKVQGVIAVAPFLTDVNRLEPLLEQEEKSRLRFYLVASEEDEYCLSVAIKLSKLFSRHEITHELDIYDDVGHAFPPSFEKRLPDALEFVANGSIEEQSK